MKFIRNYSIVDFGIEIHFIEEHGYAYGRVYVYNDDKNTAYISDINVDLSKRNNNIGNILLTEIETTSFNYFKNKYFYLKVDKNSWMYNWYLRKGYKDDIIDKENNNIIWMMKCNYLK